MFLIVWTLTHDSPFESLTCVGHCMLSYDFIVHATQKNMTSELLSFYITNWQLGFWTASTKWVLGQERIKMTSFSTSIVSYCPWKEDVTLKEESPTDSKILLLLYSQHPGD